MKKNLKWPNLLIIIAGLMFLTVSCDDEGDPTPDPGTLQARIDVSDINFIIDLQAIDGRRIKANQTVVFSDNSTGEPDLFEWIFEGGPANVTEPTAEVTWTEEVGQVMVILQVSRSIDNESDADTLYIQVGPVEMLDRVVFGLEDADSEVDAISKWYSWSPNLGENIHQLEASDGANGTSQSLKVVLPSDYTEFQLRTNEYNFGNNATLQSFTDYVFSYYIKASDAFTLSESSLLNKDGEPVQDWWTPTWDQNIEVGTTWQKKTFEFNTGDISAIGDSYSDGTANNAGPFFKHFGSLPGDNLTIWIDEISLKEKEQN
jgi:hypothetical protein